MNIIKKQIEFSDVEILLSIGIHAHERVNRQRFLISLKVDVIDIDENENIDQTLDYDLIYKYLKNLEKTPHFELQETVCKQILKFVCALPSVLKVEVQTSKPDIFDDVRSIGFTMVAENGRR